MSTIRNYIFIRGLFLLLILPISPIQAYSIDLDCQVGSIKNLLLKANHFNVDYISSSITEKTIPNSIIFPVKVAAYEKQKQFFKSIFLLYLFYCPGNFLDSNLIFSILDHNCILLI